MFKSKVKSIVLAFSVTVLAGALISYPEQSFEASIRGLNMWWEIVFPSLLPFFIISEMMIGFGVVRFLGVLLEPLMRPLFKVPGAGGFVWAMGLASGFPSGAKLTARIRQEGQISQIEAERLVSFTNCSNPLFIFGAVSWGFFHNKNLGVILALSHYLSNICVGLIMRFHGKSDAKKQKRDPVSLKMALAEMHRTRLKEKRPIGKLLGDAVLSSIQTLLMIGGFIILFSVVNKLLFHMNITTVLARLIESILSIIQFPESLSLPFISGIFEITLGSQMTSQVQGVPLMQQAVLTSFILAFSGLSVQAQVASILAETDIRFFPFFIARILQGFLSATITYILWLTVYDGMENIDMPLDAQPVFARDAAGWNITLYEWLNDWGPLITLFSLIVYIIIYAKHLNNKK
ncbi:sporulation integral membrane protein YlbJ [Peribacillus sp. SCS-155]|uniref:sporulation integral membrane protein YlbJ n=1 Tax=Peribacillus sedimenti TaxID=3115297 RepID=UPI003905EDD8